MEPGPVTLSIGVFAHNEARSIARVIRGLAGQDVWSWLAARGASGELVVLANGCRDDTAAVARAERPEVPGLRVRVEDLPEPGKSRTWNRFVHDLADPSASLLVFCDGDIELPDRCTVRILAEYLLEHPGVLVSTSRPTKDLELRPPRGVVERLSRSTSTLSQGVGRHSISGSLYCARRALVSGIVMPVGLLGEDGFMRLAAATVGFSADPLDARIERVPGARHVFRPCEGVAQYLDHERRLVMGTAQNMAVWDWIRAGGGGAAGRIRDRNEAEPGWAAGLLRESMMRTGVWPWIGRALRRRVTEWRSQPWRRRVTLIPALAAKTGMACLATLRAYRAAVAGQARW